MHLPLHGPQPGSGFTGVDTPVWVECKEYCPSRVAWHNPATFRLPADICAPPGGNPGLTKTAVENGLPIQLFNIG